MNVVDKSIKGIISPFYIIESERVKIHRELSIVQVQDAKLQFRSIRKKPQFRNFLIEVNHVICKKA